MGIGCIRQGGYIIEDYKISHIEGKLLTFIESIGLRDTQEKATKDIIREIIWSLYNSDNTWITGEDIIAIEQKYRENGSGRVAGNTITPR